MRNSKWTLVKVTAAVVMMLSMTVGADVGVVSNPLLDGDAGNSDVEFVVGTDGGLTIQFEVKSLITRPRPDTYGSADPAVAVSPRLDLQSSTWSSFVGDYTEDGVKGVQFRIRNNGEVLPYDIRLKLYSSENGTWAYEDIRIQPDGSEWITNSVVFDRRAGWDRVMDGTEEDKQAHFESTLSDVDSLSLYVHQRGSHRDKFQSVSVAGFVLFGDGWMTDEAHLAVGLIENFGVKSKDDLSPDQLTQDSDRDGVTDVDAISAGDDPGVALHIAGIGPSGVVLEWPCVAQGVYTVLRADSLNGDFQAIDVVTASENGYMQYTDSEGATGGPYFYKLRKRLGL